MSRRSSGITFPPTPAPSSNIAANDNHPHKRRPSKPDFSLPPPAMCTRADEDGDQESSSSGSSTPTSSYQPTSPRSPPLRPISHGRKVSSAGQYEAPAHSPPSTELPPPPTRTRKIIQMKPKPAGGPSQSSPTPKSTPTKSTGGTKRKASTTTQSGRKTARKTAHSLIERRRRGKMNEEFGVLKSLVPACEGIEMHKLAILQATIEYVRYLHQCIHDLQESRTQRPTEPQKGQASDLPNMNQSKFEEETPHASPSIFPSASTSPVFPTLNTAFSSTSTNPSPVILPGEDRSPEETAAALLMLGCDRRGSMNEVNYDSGNNAAMRQQGRGMSVRDLLSC